MAVDSFARDLAAAALSKANDTSLYKAQGSFTFSELPATIKKSMLGYVYDVSDSFVTDSRFLEGAGKVYGAGNNVAVVEKNGSYYYDVLSGLVDLSNYVTNTEFEELRAEVYYVEPTISTLTLSPNTTSIEILSSAGATFNLTSITHVETYPTNIVGALTFKRGNTVLLENIPATSTSATVSVSDSVTATSAQTITYTLSGTSKKNKTVSKSVNVSFFYGSYYGYSIGGTVTDSLIAGLTHVASSSLSGTKNVTLTTDGFVYLITSNTISNIKSSGFDVPFTQLSNYTYNGCSYKVYRIGEPTNLIVAGSYTYVIS